MDIKELTYENALVIASKIKRICDECTTELAIYYQDHDVSRLIPIRDELYKQLDCIYTEDVLNAIRNIWDYQIRDKEGFYDDIMSVEFITVKIRSIYISATSHLGSLLIGYFNEKKAGFLFSAYMREIFVPVVSHAENFKTFYFKNKVSDTILNDMFVQQISRASVFKHEICVFAPDSKNEHKLLLDTESFFTDDYNPAFRFADSVKSELEKAYSQNNSKSHLFAFFDFPEGYSTDELSLIRDAIFQGGSKGIYIILVDGSETRLSQEQNQFVSEIESQCIVSPDFKLDEFFYSENKAREYLEDRKKIISQIGMRWHFALNSFEGVSNIRWEEPGSVPKNTVFPEIVCIRNVKIDLERASNGKVYDISETKKQIISKCVNLTGRNSHGMVICKEDNVQLAQKFLHNVMWGFLSSIPVTKLNICVFDGKRRGESIYPFLDMQNKIPDLFDGRIHCNQEDIYDRLKRLNDSISECIQTKLGNKYQNIIEYNNKNQFLNKEIQLLIINDFPCGFDDRSVKCLADILAYGSKCGIYVYISYNEDLEPTTVYGSSDNYFEKIKEHVSFVQPLNYKFDFDPFVSGQDVIDFTKCYMEKMEVIKQTGISFDRIMEQDSLNREASDSLDIPIGIGDDGKIIELSFGKSTSQHALIAGGTGSGKSTLLHTLIMSGMVHYSPSELNLYLMDFKNGTEFKVYDNVHVPHIKRLSLDSMQEYGESILEELVDEMEAREKDFKQVGATNLKEYKKITGIVKPRILIVIDEFQVLFEWNRNNKIASNSAKLATKIIKEGRAAGIHLLMATQSIRNISNLSFEPGTIELMNIRVGMKCSEADANGLFKCENGVKALNMMKGVTGTAVMTEDYTKNELTALRVAFCGDKDEKKSILNKIKAQYKDAVCDMKVFESDNTPKLIDALKDNDDLLEKTSNITKIAIGEFIKGASVHALAFSRGSLNNVLICSSSSNEALIMANRLYCNILFGIYQKDNAKLYCIDNCDVDSKTRVLYDLYKENRNGFSLAQTDVDIINAIKEIYSIYKLRKKQSQEEINEPLFVVINRLERLEIVKDMMRNERINERDYIDEDEDDTATDDIFGFGTMNSISGDTNISESFLKLVKLGHQYNIHFVVVCSEYQTVRENMFYGENILKKFTERFVFAMNNDEANNLIEEISIESLKDNMVYYSNSNKNMKHIVKPYISPEADEIRDFM